MNMQAAYDAFIAFHQNQRTGSALDRIQPGLQHAEEMFAKNVWWPAFHHFDNLYPEYEIRDFKDGHRYLDFAYLQPHYRLAIEIDGVSTHWREITTDQFCDHCHRQNHLVIDGWHVLRFAFKDVRDRPRICQQTIQQLIGRITGAAAGYNLKSLNITDREILRLAMKSIQPITARDVMDRCNLQNHAARQHLKNLAASGWLEPANNRQRVHGYRLHPARSNIRFTVD